MSHLMGPSPHHVKSAFFQVSKQSRRVWEHRVSGAPVVGRYLLRWRPEDLKDEQSPSAGGTGWKGECFRQRKWKLRKPGVGNGTHWQSLVLRWRGVSRLEGRRRPWGERPAPAGPRRPCEAFGLQAAHSGEPLKVFNPKRAVVWLKFTEWARGGPDGWAATQGPLPSSCTLWWQPAAT